MSRESLGVRTYLNSSELGSRIIYCHHDTGKEEGRTLDELAREGARRMLVSALEEEVTAYLERHADAEAGCWWSGRDRAGAGHHLWCGHPGSSAPRVNERRVNEQEERVPVWEVRSPGSFASAAWRTLTCTCGADGVHFNVRLSDVSGCVLIGARADGRRS
ncbi:MAG: hypothetical protein ACREV3_12800 [Gammaproteobacteria bacterium]